MKVRWSWIALVAAACAHGPKEPPRAAEPAGTALGKVDFETSCDPAVRADFNRAVALLHHMTYVPARAAFAAVAERDPRCAMAQWGIAMTLFQPLWPTRPSADDLAAGWQATEKARSMQKTEREQRWLDAVAAFFESPREGDYWQRIDRWAARMQAVERA